MRCAYCHLPITNPASVKNGMGPVCFERNQVTQRIRIKQYKAEDSADQMELFDELQRWTESESYA